MLGPTKAKYCTHVICTVGQAREGKKKACIDAITTLSKALGMELGFEGLACMPTCRRYNLL